MISFTRSWRNWQTHYLEVVAGQPMEVQILSSAAKQARESHHAGGDLGLGQGQVSRGANPLEVFQS